MPKTFKLEKARKHKGIIDTKVLRLIVFVIITLSTLACVTISIFSLWDFTGKDAIWKSLATFVTVLLGCTVMIISNEVLGPKE